MKETLLLLCFLFNFCHSFSQEKRIDSIVDQFKKCKIDTTRIDLLFSACSYYRDVNPEKTIHYGLIALQIALDIKDEKRSALLYDMVGQGYEQVGNISNAIINFDKSYKIAYKTHNSKAIAGIKLNLGACYTDIGNYPLAIEYCKIAIEYFTKFKDTIGVCRSDIYLSDALFKSGSPDEALYYLERARRISLDNDNYLLHYIYTNFAEAYYLKKNYSLAIINASKAAVISDSLNDLYSGSADILIYAKVYLAMNDLKGAKTNVQKGLKIAQASNIRESLVEAYNIYSNVLEKENNYKEAFKYKCLYMIANDSDQSASNNNIVQSFENERKAQDLAVIKAEEKQKDAELKNQRLLIAAILGTLIVLIGLTILISYSRNKLMTANLAIERANRELKNYNEQIKHQSEHIEELGKLKDRLFAIISHDLRGPLKNLQSFLNLLVTEKLSIVKFNEILPILVRGVSNTTDLVENLLYWSKSQLKGATVNKTYFDVNSLIQNQLVLFENQVVEKQIKLSNQTPLNTIIYADKSMIDLVLRNLVYNAIKFCNKEGHVEVTAKCIEGFLEISVTDSGVGIAPENIEKIFQTKEKYTTLGTNNEIGTGLGLLLCKEFIEQNNGIIGVESGEGKGTRFWFTVSNG